MLLQIQTLHRAMSVWTVHQFGLLLFLLLGLVTTSLGAHAEPSSQTVDRIKAAYIYNFAKFVDLPAPDDKTLRLCVIGKNDLNGALQALQHRVAQGREVVVRKEVSIDQIKDCTMVFVGETEATLLPLAARQVGASGVLVISDARQAVDRGAHLALVFSEDRVEFDVNLQQLQKSGIKASSQMLKLARSVVR